MEIAPGSGKLGILLVGLGAVSTTVIAGVHAIRKKLAPPVGSLTELGTIRLGKRTEGRSPRIREIFDLPSLDDIVFGGWDIFEEDCYAAARTAGVLEPALLDQLRPELEAVKPMPAVFDQQYVKRLDGPNVKKGRNKKDLAEQLIADIRSFKQRNRCERLVLIWCGSTEVFMKESSVHQSIDGARGRPRAERPVDSLEHDLRVRGDQGRHPYANAAPNLSADIPALLELAAQTKSPLAGKDLKTGQTLMKTIVAPGLKARLLGVAGWYSTNILGNRDGEVLDDPESFKTKEESKKSVLDYIFQPHLYPGLYDNLHHVVRINYYPPRGDNKEGWDNIDIVGWLGYPMQLKINFLCRDSILAAPIVLDTALFLDLARRAGMSGIQEWLSFYFKSPMHAPGLYPEHDLFIQLMKLKNTLRYLKGEELITHLGRILRIVTVSSVQRQAELSMNWTHNWRTMSPAKLQPALLGGVAIGVLSALPVVNIGKSLLLRVGGVWRRARRVSDAAEPPGADHGGRRRDRGPDGGRHRRGGRVGPGDSDQHGHGAVSVADSRPHSGRLPRHAAGGRVRFSSRCAAGWPAAPCWVQPSSSA